MKSETVEPPSRLTIDLLNRSDSDLDTDPLERGVRSALLAHGLKEGEVCVLLTSDEEIRELNLKHRKLDEATDVLTFPSPSNGAGHLGDIAIAVPYAMRQAKLRGVPLGTEIAYLGIHGALHLAEFEDESEGGRRLMQAEMAHIASVAGLTPDPSWLSLGHATPSGRTR